MSVLFGGKFRPILAARDTWFLAKTFQWRVDAMLCDVNQSTQHIEQIHLYSESLGVALTG